MYAQLSHPMWRCAQNAMGPVLNHLVSYHRFCSRLRVLWPLVYRLWSVHGGWGHLVKHDAELWRHFSCMTGRVGLEGVTPHRHGWASQIAQPRRRPTATWMALSSMWRPQALIGSVCSQSPLCGAAAASSLAQWYGSVYLLSSWLYSDSTTDLSNIVIVIHEFQSDTSPEELQGRSVCGCLSRQASLSLCSCVLKGICHKCHRWHDEHDVRCGPGAGVCPQQKPQRRMMQAMTHVAIQDHHCAPVDWPVATDHRLKIRCRC